MMKLPDLIDDELRALAEQVLQESIANPNPWEMMAVRGWNAGATEAEVQEIYRLNESARIANALSSLKSPVYRARAERMGMYSYLKHHSIGQKHTLEDIRH